MNDTLSTSLPDRGLPRTYRYRIHAALAGLLLAVLVLAGAGPARAIDVPTGDPVYEFLQRAEAMGWLDEPLHGVRPYSRLTITGLLDQAYAHRTAMSATDRALLARYRFELGDELAWLNQPAVEPDSSDGYQPYWSRSVKSDLAWLLPDGRDAIRFNGNNGPRDWLIAINPHGRLETYDRLRDNVPGDVIHSTVWASGASLRFRQGAFSAYGLAVDNHVLSSSIHVDSLRYPYRYSDPPTGPDKNIDFYDTEASVAWHSEHVELTFAKARQRWGGGETGSLLINDSSLPHTHLRLHGHWGPFMATFAQGRLQTEPRIVEQVIVQEEDEDQEVFAKKWYAAQWFELHPWKQFRVAAFQQVIYGRRDFDWEYLFPLMHLHGAEHYTGDPDNMLLGGDLRWLAPGRVIVRTQIVLDEFALGDFGKANNRNKWGLLAGLGAYDPLGAPNAYAFAEYVRLRPYLYTHKYPINRSTHLGSNLGYPLPPNSDRLTLGWRQQLSASLALTLTAAQTRHGRNPDGAMWGGAVTDSDQNTSARTEVATLDGDRFTQQEIGLAVRWELVYQLQLDGSVRYVNRELDPLDGPTIDDNDWLFQLMLRLYPY